MRKLIASDFDGTIRCGEDSVLTNGAAIKKWREAGNVFGIVTGRGVKSVLEEVAGAVEADFIICNNGAACIRDGNFLFADECDTDLVPELCEFASGLGDVSFAFLTLDTDIRFGPGDIPESVNNYPKFAQFTIKTSGDEESVRIGEKINQKYDKMLIAYPNGKNIDIVKYGVSKATGVSEAAKLFDIDESLCYTVGDNLNDLVMIEAFTGYAVAGAKAEVKQRAKYTVDSVADMIESLL